MTKIDHDGTEQFICPHCGHVGGEMECPEEDAEMEWTCSECGKDFQVVCSVRVHIDYSTYKYQDECQHDDLLANRWCRDCKADLENKSV